METRRERRTRVWLGGFMALLMVGAAVGWVATSTGAVEVDDAWAGSKRVRGIKGEQAPEWSVDKWFNLPDGTDSIDISDYEGKVVYLYFFQSWCPGCHSHGFPTMKAVREELADRDDVVFVAVQTTFEGFSVNDESKAKSTVDEFGLDIPVGHDMGDDDNSPAMMARYRSGGTPWTIIIDRQGVVQYNDFSIKKSAALALIESL